MRLAVSEIITNAIKKLNLSYLQLSAEHKEKLLVLKKKLGEE